jgi:hypothetical protein
LLKVLQALEPFVQAEVERITCAVGVAGMERGEFAQRAD